MTTTAETADSLKMLTEPEQAAEQADQAVSGMGEHIYRVISDLAASLTWENLILQILAVIVSAAIGYWLSTQLDRVLLRYKPARREPGLSAHFRAFGITFLHNVSFSFLSGTVLAFAMYFVTNWFGFSSQSMIIARVAYNIFFAYALLSLLLSFMQEVLGWQILTAGVRRFISAVFWVLAVLQFFGVTSDMIEVLNSLVIPLGSGSMTLWTLIVAICTVLLTLAVANWLANLVHQLIDGLDTLSPNLKIIFGRVVSVIFMVLAVIIALGAVGIDLTVLSVFGGAFGVGLGFGLQKIASNYVSGFIILLDKSIKIGDFVEVSGFRGRVTEINTRFTVVRSNEGIENIVPNESFVTSSVLNLSYSETAMIQYVEVGVAYGADIRKALDIMLEEGGRDRPRIDMDRKPWACLDSFGDSGINLKLGFWVRDPVNGTASLRTDISLDIYRRFAEEGIEIPYNRLEINLREVDAPAVPVQIVGDKPAA